MAPERIHLVFSGGVTGGHLFPGLAVAEQLVAAVPDVRITFAGSGRSLEWRQVGAAGFDYLAVPSRPLPPRARDALAFLVENLAGYLAAKRFLAEHRVAGVVGLGGYASVPVARAAARRGLPLILLEQNAVPGRATRWLARRAACVCAAVPQTRRNLRCRCPVRVTGTPVRPGFFAEGRTARRLLVLGGSRGARSLNQSVPRALYKIRRQTAGWQIVHQTGEADWESTRTLYRKLDLPARVVPFVSDMPSVLGASSLAVSRCGGATLAELAAAGVPAVLIPYPFAADDHQRSNADVFAAAGGAVTLDARELCGRLDDHLAGQLRGLMSDADRRARMSAAMRRMARPRAAAEVADLILQAAGRPAGKAGARAAA